MGTVFLASMCRYSSGVPGRDHASGRLTRSVALLDTRRELARPAGASSKVCKNGLTSLRILGDNPESAKQIPPDNGEILPTMGILWRPGSMLVGCLRRRPDLMTW